MLHSIVIVALLCFSTLPPDREAQVCISLFSLFKPQVVNARVASGPGARVEVDGTLDSRLTPGETLRVRRVGERLNVSIADSSGRVGRSLGGRVARIVPLGSTTLELILPNKIKRVYRGEVRFSDGERGSLGQLQIVLETDRESAVASIVGAEMRGERATEALKALSVVVRSFMVGHAKRHFESGFDFCDTTHCQLYRGEEDLLAETSSPAIANAAVRTKGEVLGFGGRPIASYYTAFCGGLSATPEMVWGGGGSDGYPFLRIPCRWCQSQRYFRWKRSADTGSVLAALSEYLGERFTSAASIDIDPEPSSQFVRGVTVRGGITKRVMSADAFRRAIGFKLGWNTVLSPSFTIERRGARFVFRGRGFGSQVGLCLGGAVAQAGAGRSYRDILTFYFPGADVTDGAPGE
ncbi:MAG TPA: SpoIID/LytB domain-containing protein [Blastocatellia bacterium]|nr:SpoIID/LytB domain-containing protein [Blastocatellia bacterium]